MKSRHSQAGSAHLVIIIVLAVALIGVLGFVFWQNFVNKPAPKTADTTQTTQTTSSKNTVAVSEWGVKGTTTEDTTGLTYKIASNTETDGNGKQYTYDSLTFITKGLEDACQKYAGTVLRYSDPNAPAILSGDGPPETVAQAGFTSVNGHYFNFLHPQSACDGDQTDQDSLQQTSIQIASDFAASIVKQ